MIPNEFWIVVSQYDGEATGFHYGHVPTGPLVHEGFCHTEEKAIERAKAIGTRYGWVTIMKVVSEGGKQS